MDKNVTTPESRIRYRNILLDKNVGTKGGLLIVNRKPTRPKAKKSMYNCRIVEKSLPRSKRNLLPTSSIGRML